MTSKSSHYYYGAVDAYAVAPDNIQEHFPSSDSQQTSPQDAILSSSVQQHQELLAAYEIQKAARSVVAPTLDQDVQARLRQLGEPICFFGEGPYERRERLKLVMAQQSIKSLGLPQEVAVHVESSRIDQQRHLFFSQGGGALLAARKDIARFSLPRAVKRLKSDKKEFDSVDPLEIEHRVANYNRSIKKKIEVLVSQVGSERPMACGRFAPRNCILATSSWSPVVRVWAVPTNHELRKGFVGHKERVNSVCWNPTFESSIKQTMSYDEIRDVSYTSPFEDISNVEFSQGWHLASGSFDSSIGIWSLNSDHPLQLLKGHEDRVNRVACHPSGKYVASTSHDETWRLWDVEIGTELLVQEGHSTGTYGLTFHQDGSLIFTGDLGGIVRGWDLRTGRTVIPLLGHVKQILGISINSWRSNQLATCSDDNTVRVWDIRKQRCIDLILAHDKLISDVVYEPVHGRYLLTASYDNSMKIWSSTEFSCSAILHEHEARVTGADISSDGECIVSVSFDRTFKLWTFTKKFDDDEDLFRTKKNLIDDK